MGIRKVPCRVARSQIVAVANSDPQRDYVEGEAARRGLANLRVVTADMNAFDPGEAFDRIVSVEMLAAIADAGEIVAQAGRPLLHAGLKPPVQHLSVQRADPDEWIAQHFFTGSVMPSHHLIRQYADLFEVEKEWRWSGTHYHRTALDWLANFDAHADEIEAVLRTVHGRDTTLWMRRWRWFFLATSGLFGYAEGSEWGVSQYRMRAVQIRVPSTRMRMELVSQSGES